MGFGECDTFGKFIFRLFVVGCGETWDFGGIDSENRSMVGGRQSKSRALTPRTPRGAEDAEGGQLTAKDTKVHKRRSRAGREGKPPQHD